jgi:Uma2 family endonuclease
MGETGFHVLAIFHLYTALRAYFRRKKVYVGADMFLYYREGDPRAVKAPDVMVIKGVAKHIRRTFKVWEENATPCAIFEITSASTLDEDEGPKMEVYGQLGVSEYFLFDPEGECLDPPLRGFRLRGSEYVRLAPAEDGSLTSKQLGLRLLPEGHLLRLIDAVTGRQLLTPEERLNQVEERAKEQGKRLRQERQRAEQAEQRAEALEAELARLRQAAAARKRRK